MTSREAASKLAGIVLTLFIGCSKSEQPSPSSSPGDSCVSYPGEGAVSLAWSADGRSIASTWIDRSNADGVVRMTRWPSLATVELDRSAAVAAESGAAVGPDGVSRWLLEVDGRGQLWQAAPDGRKMIWRTTESPDLFGLQWGDHGLFAWEEQSAGARVVSISDDDISTVFSESRHFSQFWIEPDGTWLVAEIRAAPGAPVDLVVKSVGGVQVLRPHALRIMGPSMDPDHRLVIVENHNDSSVIGLPLDGTGEIVLRAGETGPYRLSKDRVAAYVDQATFPEDRLCFTTPPPF